MIRERKIKKLLYTVLFLVLAGSLSAQDDNCRRSTEGTDFWFGFMESRNYNTQHFIEITVTARETTTFQVFIGNDETPFNGIYTVQANTSRRIQIPWQQVETLGSEEIQDKGIRLTSEKPVNVYALNWDQNSADVAVIYPVPSLGTEYFAVCYEPRIHERNNGSYGNGRNSQFLIVGAADATKVMIIPSKVTDKLVDAGDTIEVVLDKGEVYQVQSMNQEGLPGQGDLTGSYVLASKPVAFYSGSLATTVPAEPGVSAWDHLYEQIPPIHSWGREYYTVPLKSREQDLYRVMAAHDNTIVHIDGMTPFTLDRGEFKEFVLYHDEPKRIFSELPILVVQYSQSQSVDASYTGKNGDPFMIVLSSITQTKNDVTFVAYDSDQIRKYYVNVITLTEETGNILLDGNSVQSQFVPFPESNYSYAQIALNPGTYRLHSTNPDRGFLAYVYGFGGVESYGYGVGFNLNLVLDLGKSINFEGDTLLLCYGDSRTLDAGPYFDTYTWSTGDTTQTITANEQGTYKVTVSTVDGCVLEDSIYLFVSHPDTDLGIDYDQGCFPHAVELDALEGFPAYAWQNESGDTLSTSRMYTADQTGNYRVTVTDQYGCTDRDSMELVVFPVPETEISGPSLVCGDKTATLSATITGTADSIWNYPGSVEWKTDRPDKLTFTGNTHTSVQAEITAYGTYSIYHHLTTIDGCVQRDTFTMRFHPQPDPSFVLQSDERCEGYSQQLHFDGSATDSATFYWDLGGCQFLDTLGPKDYLVTIGAFLDEQPYISLYIDDNGCVSDTIVEQVGAKPNFTMEASQLRGCDALTVDFSSTMLTADIVEFTWEFEDGETAHSQNVSKHFAQPGFYGVKLTVTNPVTQCTNSFALDSMISVFPTPVAVIAADPQLCYPDSAKLTYPYPTDSSFYSWEFVGMHQTGGEKDSVTVRLDDPLSTATLIVEEHGCASTPAEIQLKRKPRFNFDTPLDEGCQPLETEIFAETEDNALLFEWYTDSLPPSTGDTKQVFLPYPGSYDVELIARSQETGCSDTLLKADWLRVYPTPKAKFQADYPTAYLDNALISYLNQSEDGDYYFWDFGDGGTDTAVNPSHQYTAPGEYIIQLAVESEHGCTDTTEMPVIILPSPAHAPNAFHPGSPLEENRTFLPLSAGMDPSRYHLSIYNRDGQVVFETHSPEEAWDGTLTNGKPAPMGNYIWIARFYDLQGEKRDQKGQVMLLR